MTIEVGPAPLNCGPANRDLTRITEWLSEFVIGEFEIGEFG